MIEYAFLFGTLSCLQFIPRTYPYLHRHEFVASMIAFLRDSSPPLRELAISSPTPASDEFQTFQFARQKTCRISPRSVAGDRRSTS